MAQRKRVHGQQVKNRMRHVDGLAEIADYSWLNTSWPPKNQGGYHGRLITAVLLKSSMLAQTVPMVRHIDHQRVTLQVQLFQFAKDHAHVAIEVANRSVVSRDDSLFLFGRELTEDKRNLPRISGHHPRN